MTVPSCVIIFAHYHQAGNNYVIEGVAETTDLRDLRVLLSNHCAPQDKGVYLLKDSLRRRKQTVDSILTLTPAITACLEPDSEISMGAEQRKTLLVPGNQAGALNFAPYASCSFSLTSSSTPLEERKPCKDLYHAYLWR